MSRASLAARRNRYARLLAPRSWRGEPIVGRARTASAEQLVRGVEALETALAGVGVVVALPHRLLRRLVDEDAAGPGDPGDPARPVDASGRSSRRTARSRDRRRGRRAGTGTRPLLPRRPRSGATAASSIGSGSARDHHRRVADHLHQAHRRRRRPRSPSPRSRPATEPSSSGAISSPSLVNSTRSAKQTATSAVPRISPGGEVGGADHVAADLLEQCGRAARRPGSARSAASDTRRRRRSEAQGRARCRPAASASAQSARGWRRRSARSRSRSSARPG